MMCDDNWNYGDWVTMKLSISPCLIGKREMKNEGMFCLICVIEYGVIHTHTHTHAHTHTHTHTHTTGSDPNQC
jgi:hypothetical protein